MKQEKSWKERGQALVEFALILPVLMLFVAGIFDFGRYIFTYAQASQQLRTAVREAPVIGFGNATVPPYVQCGQMDTIAKNVYFAESHTVTITYLDDSLNVIGDGDCDSDGEVDKDDVETGYLIKITSHGWVRPVFNTWIGDIEFNFIGQRTIVKSFNIGSSDIALDTDYDGLLDEWEEFCYGNKSLYNATDDPWGNNKNNGLYEYDAGSPPYTTAAACPPGSPGNP